MAQWLIRTSCKRATTNASLNSTRTILDYGRHVSSPWSSKYSTVIHDSQKADKLRIRRFDPVSRGAPSKQQAIDNYKVLPTTVPTGSEAEVLKLTPVSNTSLRLESNSYGVFLQPIFLRDQCNCRLCVDVDSGQKVFETTDIPSNISIRSLRYNKKNMSVEIQWLNDIPEYTPQHTTSIPRKYLSKWWKLPKSKTWMSPSFDVWTRNEIDQRLMFVEYDLFMNNASKFSDAVSSLQRDGLIIVQNVPKDEGAVENLGEKFGLLRNTFYGRTWDVKDVEKAQNVAYTSKHLNLHMDLLYMKNPPGFQLLHCINSSPDGGVSLFSDSYKAAFEMPPWALEMLATFPITYAYSKGGHFFEDTKPVIELAPYIESRRSPKDIVAVNWSPPFQGPMKHDIGLSDGGYRLQKWLVAAKLFRQRINVETNTYLHKLEPGQCVIFNNRRILHGRTAFSNDSRGNSNRTDYKQEDEGSSASDGATPRWLKGAYLDTQDFESTYQRVVKKRQ